MKENERQFVVVNGIAYGEEAKGNTVQAVVRKLNAHTVWRSGGWQGGHHITHDDGREAALSFFGAGSFEGARTYLKHMVISPVELFNEALELERKGVPNPLSLVSIDENCLTTTPFHSAISRTREILRGEDKKGTIGKGVGEAIRDSIDPELAIRAGEFRDTSTVKIKAENIRLLKLSQAKELIANYKGRVPEDVYAELSILEDESIVELVAEACSITSDLVKITDDDYLNRLLKTPGAIVNEVSHGALHHPRYGFVPHVTQVDPTSRNVIDTVRSHDYEGNLIRLGILRSYLTRHGAGPLISYNPELTNSLPETHNNAANDWLGEFRVGNFDSIALRYALEISGGKDTFDGLFISYLDALAGKNEWQVCDSYEYNGERANLSDYFLMSGGKITGIKIHEDRNDQAHYEHQMELTNILKNCTPVLRTLRSSPGRHLEQVFIDYVNSTLRVPVVGTAYGPKVTDRYFRPEWQNALNKQE